MKNFNQFDVVIVGAGFAGSVIARQLADNNKKVLIIEKRNHIGGNAYDYFDKDKLLIQKYGPHIFHTGDKKIWNFVNRFSKFFPYKHRVVGYINDISVPIPFNFKSLELTHSKADSTLIKRKLKAEFPDKKKVSILDLRSSKDPIIKKFAEYVYKNIFYFYTYKQWGSYPDKINNEVLSRVPIMLGYEDTYFYDKYQYMPLGGFTQLFDAMLKHNNIKVVTDLNITNIIKFSRSKIYLNGELYKGKFIYTGAIDELFGYKFGVLPYRTLNFKLEKYNCGFYQPKATVNYPTSEKFTRISEYKYFDPKNTTKKTIIAKEYSSAYSLDCGTDPYYPINNKINNNIYEKYKNLANKHNIVLCGRLAEYRYYTMEATIKSAFIISQNLYKNTK